MFLVLVTALLVCGLLWPETDVGAIARFAGFFLLVPLLFVVLPLVLLVAGPVAVRDLIVNRRLARRKRRGLCPSCGYDRRGIQADVPCPECGSKP